MIKTYIHAEREKFSGGVSISMMVEDCDRFSAAQTIIMQQIDPQFPVEPFIRLDKTCAQQLMDELWQCGFRPSEGTGSAGSLAATERHLKDMQTIAFRFLEKAKL